MNNTPRQQVVTDTSKAAHRASTNSRQTQREAVAQFIYLRTKAGFSTWITAIADNAHRLGHPGLVKNAGARLNELKKYGATIRGREYVLVKMKDKILPPGGKTHVEAWTFVLKSSQPDTLSQKQDSPIEALINAANDVVNAAKRSAEVNGYQAQTFAIHDSIKALKSALEKVK